MMVLFLLNGSKMGLSPRRGDTLPDKREIWHGVRSPVPNFTGPLPHAKFHVYRGEHVGIQPQKLSKFRILARYLYLSHGRLVCNIFYEILSNCTRL